jgi:hypothetical protein
MDNQETFEHGSGGSPVSKGMGSGGGGTGITNRGMEREQREQQQLPERGRSQSER